MNKAVIVYSGGLDSVCMAAYLSTKYELYAISFSYGQKANSELKAAKKLSKKIGIKDHKIIDISFMKELYGNTNSLTSSDLAIPSRFEYSVVVPIRNAIFLTIASAWAYSIGAKVVAFGAHTGDKNYPDCRPIFSKRLESALNLGERDGIRKGLRKEIKIWSPYGEGISKSQLLKLGFERLGDAIFQSWSCYSDKQRHCGVCESCINRKNSFIDSQIKDKTRYY